MKERPVIFNGEMVSAILDGRKTQTRRIVSRSADIESISTHLDWVHSGAYGTHRPSDKEYANKAESLKTSGLHAFRDANGKLFGLHCPFGYTGDRLWVRETFMDLTGTGIEATTGKFEGFAYRADTPAGSYGDEVRKEYGLKWTPSLHMPRKACRILLEITAVRVERLNDISDGDAIREGCNAAAMRSGDCVADVFARLWSSIYGGDSWNANPWVWVIEFRRVEVRDASK